MSESGGSFPRYIIRQSNNTVDFDLRVVEDIQVLGETSR